MVLHLNIIEETERSTVSELTLEEDRICYVIEDAGRVGKKVPGETRIPAGVYPVEPRRAGKFYERYSKRWGHDFVPWLRNVEGFTWILIHLGNTHKDTRGCLLPATYYFRAVDGHYWGKNSREAYLKLYDVLRAAFDRGEEVTLEVVREYPQPPADDEEPDPDPDPEQPQTPQQPTKSTPVGCFPFSSLFGRR